MGTAIKHSVPLPGRVVSVRVPGCQKITNDGLTRPGTGCFIVVPIWQTGGVKGLIELQREGPSEPQRLQRGP